MPWQSTTMLLEVAVVRGRGEGRGDNGVVWVGLRVDVDVVVSNNDTVGYDIGRRRLGKGEGKVGAVIEEDM